MYQAAEEAFHLGYRDGRDGTTRGLLRPPGEGEWERFTCLNSLRDVEGTVHLILTEERTGLEATPAADLRIGASDGQEVE